MNEDGHTNPIQLRRMASRILVTLVSLALVVPCLVWGPFGIVDYVTGRLNIESAVSSVKVAILIVILGLLALISVLALVVATFLYWRKGARRAWRNTLLLAALPSSFVASYGVDYARTAGRPPDTMFMRGLRQHMLHRADIAAIRDWLGTLNPDDVGAPGTYSNQVFFDPPDRPECINHVRPGMVVVSKDGTGHLSVCLSWGGRMVGRWGLVVTREETAIELLADSPDPRTYRLPIAPGAYICRTRPYWATPYPVQSRNKRGIPETPAK
jgi:hypothetical protein